jgi:hypothetical protein
VGREKQAPAAEVCVCSRFLDLGRQARRGIVTARPSVLASFFPGAPAEVGFVWECSSGAGRLVLMARVGFVWETRTDCGRMLGSSWRSLLECGGFVWDRPV